MLRKQVFIEYADFFEKQKYFTNIYLFVMTQSLSNKLLNTGQEDKGTHLEFSEQNVDRLVI